MIKLRTLLLGGAVVLVSMLIVLPLQAEDEGEGDGEEEETEEIVVTAPKIDVVDIWIATVQVVWPVFDAVTNPGPIIEDDNPKTSTTFYDDDNCQDMTDSFSARLQAAADPSDENLRELGIESVKVTDLFHEECIATPSG